MEKLIFKVYINGNKWKSIKLNNISINLPSIYNLIRKYDYEFIDVNKHQDLTDKFLIALLKEKEQKIKHDPKFLNRIIRGGGFINYIKQLEGSL